MKGDDFMRCKKTGFLPYRRIVVFLVVFLFVSFGSFGSSAYASYQDELGSNVFGITATGQPQSVLLQSSSSW